MFKKELATLTTQQLNQLDNPPQTICVIAGEVSGDQLGYHLIQRLQQDYPNARFVGIGGEKMQQAGCDCWYHISDLSYFGIVDVVKNLPKILRTLKHTKQLISNNKVDLFIGIDNPDFNLRIAKYCKQHLKIPSVQYVSPSVWAWRQGRIHNIKAATDLVLCLLPFEVAFYEQHQHPAVYVGHTLAKNLAPVYTLDQVFFNNNNSNNNSNSENNSLDGQAELDKLDELAKTPLEKQTAPATDTSDLEQEKRQQPLQQLLHQLSSLPSLQLAQQQLQQLVTKTKVTAASCTTNAPKLAQDSPSVQTNQLATQQDSDKTMVQQEALYETASPQEVPAYNIALLPGSRSSEIKLILGSFLDGLALAQQQGIIPSNAHIYLPVAKEKLRLQIEQIVAGYPQLQITLVTSNAHTVLQSAVFGLVASGTATLDALLCHTPIVVGYRLTPVNYWIAKKLVKTKYVALANIVMQQEFYRELLQDDLNAVNLASCISKLVDPTTNLTMRHLAWQQHGKLICDSNALISQAITQLLQR